MKKAKLFKGLGLALLTLLSGTCQAAWQNIQNSVQVSQSRLAVDRVNRSYFSYLTIENSSTEPLSQPMRVLIDHSSHTVLNPDGVDENGTPFKELDTANLAPGQTTTVRVDFELQRARMLFTAVTQAYTPWEMVWNDEFNQDQIDSNKWAHAIDCNGGGNFEKQCYTDNPENAYIENGVLKIVAKPESGLPLPYSSAKLLTKGKADFTYGRFEIRAKASRGQGAWPAIWMLPTNEVYGGWPHSGEIDIFEAVNLGVPRAPNSSDIQTDVYGTLHYGKSWPDNDQTGHNYVLANNVNPADDFHVYAIEWEEGEIRWYVDDVLFETQRQSEVAYNEDGQPDGLIHKGWYTEKNGELLWNSAPYDQDFHLILNFAVGGAWPEAVNLGGVDPNAFHAENTFEVDYVRVYECSISPTNGKGCATVSEGYDDSIAEGGTLQNGAAPTPIPPSDGVARELVIFENDIHESWPAWDCCGGSTPVTVKDDAEHGQVVEFTIGTAPTVVGFNTSVSSLPAPFDGSPMLANGVLEFDLKLVNPTMAANVNWNLKVEQGGVSSEAVVSIDPPTEQWQHYSIPLRNLAGSGLNLNGIDVVMIFPDWGQGEGAVFRVDNVAFLQGEELPPGNGLNKRVLVDFEQTQNNYSFVNFDGGVSTVISNSQISDANTSAQVVQMQKYFGQPWGGSTISLDAPIDVDSSIFSLKVWSDRPVNVLFKLESMNVERNVAHAGTGWEELNFDFSGESGANVSQITLIFDLGVMGDAAGDAANWTFLYDDIVLFEEPTIDVIDFEADAASYAFVNFDGGVSSIATNPEVTETNRSSQVVLMQKFFGQPWGGSTFTLPAAIDVEDTVFTMKVWSDRSVNVLFKLEGMNVERNVAHSGNGWEELSFDFAGENGSNVNQITLIFDLGVMGDAAGDPTNWTFYYDDISYPSANEPIDVDPEPDPEPQPDGLLVDFEGPIESYPFGNFDGGFSTIVANPQVMGINQSNQVVQMQKFAGQPWGGSTYSLSEAISVESTVFNLKVWSNRAVSVLFKLEGLNQERSVVHTGTGWEVLSFDFAGVMGSVSQLTFIFDLGIVGDAAGDPDYWTFYYDEISDQPYADTNSTTVEFEDQAGNYAFGNFAGGEASIINNPDPSGINTSSQVVRMQKFAGEPWGGSTLTLDSPINVDSTIFTMKVWANRPVMVLFKLEGMNVERNVPHSGNGWEELSFEFAGEVGSNVSQITIIFDLGINGDAAANPEDWTFYFDDIVIPSVTDSDSDGVADSIDQCPNTPFGTPVDEFGCADIPPADSDNDGVADELDMCPNTPANTVVDSSGCAIIIQGSEVTVSNGILVSGNATATPGYSLYVFDNDIGQDGQSVCYDGCAANWPPLLVQDNQVSGINGLSTIDRNDGGMQVTFEGRPLYLFANDLNPGDTNGDGVGGVWHLVSYNVDTGDIVPLFSGSTDLEQPISYDRGDAIITRFADRGRDRHAKEDQFQIYDHYLSHYWTHRTAQFEIVDYIPKGGSSIEITFVTEWKLGAREFRAWYRGIGTVAEYHGNYFGGGSVVELDNGSFDYNFNKISNDGDQYKYQVIIDDYRPLNWDPANGALPLEVGQRMEFEVSQFLDAPPEGRENYYGTTYLYIVGQGIVPWETRGTFGDMGSEREDSYPIDQQGWLGGKTTLPYNYTNEPDNHFMQMATNLSNLNGQAFVLGRRIHHTSFVDGQHDERVENGIFPEMIGKSNTRYIKENCSGCHERNGRAAPVAIGEPLDKWVFKVADENGLSDPDLGNVLQPKTLYIDSNQFGEGEVSIDSWRENNGLRSPNYVFSKKTPAKFSARIAPQLVGLELLEAIPEEYILSMEDPDDIDGDGISGRAQRVFDPQTAELRLGRFGYKAATSSIKHQVAAAFNTDLGVMTSVLPTPDCGSNQHQCGNSGSELADEHLDDLVKYIALLGVRAQRDIDDPQVQQGKAIFSAIDCASCHTPQAQTSVYHPFSELRDQTIYPYTDLLLHDMGEGLADNLGEGIASGAEWRTAPLWGLGLSACVTGGVINEIGGQGNEFCTPEHSYLHDGRARTIEEAILWHGGESEQARVQFESLSNADKNALLAFLNSL
ncbi:di-heme oxidoredictase family protein [Aliiglaciecola lipolytica]|uniref:Uncharacterized protein n=1 Tax=Aliiglaciecola lipolytica E3 TaxID=1127673 RepID=K6Y954_9ALTE|nr:di-heme oxidoredictase family protein [Aliiglaciecola lipolytica]GAC13198.1 hypothetical protein GLIP_0552 [Aliiglaciecola lipolytica E3]